MKIGIIGCGNIGKGLARLWIKAGHQVMVSSRHPDDLKLFAKELGPHASVGTPEDAARFGEVVLLTIPLGEIPKLSKKLQGYLKNKIVLDTCNPYAERDGAAGVEALNDPVGSGMWTSKHLPGAIIVKAFNTVYYKLLETQSHRRQNPIGVPLASDDEYALQLASQLVKDAGFGPVIVGRLQRAKEFDNGTHPYASGATASELTEMFAQRNAKSKATSSRFK